MNVPKLEGPENYRSWKRSMEVALSSKRKLGFVTGTIKTEDQGDDSKKDQWDTCNHMVIAWLTGAVSDNIRESVLYFSTAKEIWKQLESRFSRINGAHEYKLIRTVYQLKQRGRSINEYYTEMRKLWIEIDSLNHLPAITNMTEEFRAFVAALNEQKEKQRLYQFLNGLDEDNGWQRSQFLMGVTLPTVEEVCATLQQEEAQRENLSEVKEEDVSAMYGKNSGNFKPAVNNASSYKRPMQKPYDEACPVCGVKGHSEKECWKIVGYPKWHPKHKKMERYKEGDNSKGIKQGNYNKWNKGKGVMKGNKFAGQAQGSEEHVAVTADQLERLLKLIPNDDKEDTDGDEEQFAGLCYPEK